MFGLAHGAVLLAPTEDALDHGPAGLGDAIADVTGGALVDGAGAAPAGLGRSIVLRDVRRDIHAAQGAHVISAIIGLVLAHRDAPATWSGLAFEHRLGSTPFGCAVGLRNYPCDGKTIAVLHDDMPHVAQPRLATASLAIKLGIRVAGRGMSVVLAALAMEVGTVVALVTILRLETLVRRPSLDQRAIDREMIVRQQRPDLRVIKQLGHELLQHLTALQAFPVLGESRRIPHPIVG